MKNSHFPIYPVLDLNKDLSGMRGLTKREYFAGLAMQGLSSIDWKIPEHLLDKPSFAAKMIAKEAVNIADALLSELEKPNK